MPVIDNNAIKRLASSKLLTGRLPVRLICQSSARRHDPSWSLRLDTDQPPPFKVAILSRGDTAARRDTTPQTSRFVRVFEALAAAGIEAQPAMYDEAFADEV